MEMAATYTNGQKKARKVDADMVPHVGTTQGPPTPPTTPKDEDEPPIKKRRKYNTRKPTRRMSGDVNFTELGPSIIESLESEELDQYLVTHMSHIPSSLPTALVSDQMNHCSYPPQSSAGYTSIADTPMCDARVPLQWVSAEHSATANARNASSLKLEDKISKSPAVTPDNQYANGAGNMQSFNYAMHHSPPSHHSPNGYPEYQQTGSHVGHHFSSNNVSQQEFFPSHVTPVSTSCITSTYASDFSSSPQQSQVYMNPTTILQELGGARPWDSFETVTCS